MRQKSKGFLDSKLPMPEGNTTNQLFVFLLLQRSKRLLKILLLKNINRAQQESRADSERLKQRRPARDRLALHQIAGQFAQFCGARYQIINTVEQPLINFLRQQRINFVTRQQQRAEKDDEIGDNDRNAGVARRHADERHDRVEHAENENDDHPAREKRRVPKPRLR